MSDQFIGEIRMFAGDFAPRGWAFCNGQVLDVSQNSALYSLFGTAYGGDGSTIFGLPDLRGRVPIQAGTGPGLSPRQLGSKTGAEQVTVTEDQLPPHTHQFHGSADNGLDANPAGNYVASSTTLLPYSETEALDTNMATGAVSSAGGSGFHDNVMPFLCINFIVALSGIYPGRS